MKRIISMIAAIVLVPVMTAANAYEDVPEQEEQIEIHVIDNRPKAIPFPEWDLELTADNMYIYPGYLEELEEKKQNEERQKVINDLAFLKFIDGAETDIDDDQIEHILATSEVTGIDPHLISTIIYSESRGQSDVYNGICRGYGGVGYDGGRLVYEDILELGDYDHDMAFDPYMNITFIGHILDYLMYHYDYNIYQAIQHYSGTKGEWWYLNYTARKLDQIGGPTLDEIEQQWRENYEQREKT